MSTEQGGLGNGNNHVNSGHDLEIITINLNISKDIDMLGGMAISSDERLLIDPYYVRSQRVINELYYRRFASRAMEGEESIEAPTFPEKLMDLLRPEMNTVEWRIVQAVIADFSAFPHLVLDMLN